MSEDDALKSCAATRSPTTSRARDLQFADGQWVRAKSLDTFCPLGPKVVELDDPQNLKLLTRVNGEVDAGLQHVAR